MRLLIITQTVDRDDPNLGAFYRWFEELGRRSERLVILAGRVGAHEFSDNVSVYSLAPREGTGRLGRLWKFWELFSREYAACDAALFHQIPEFVIAASPFLLSLKRAKALWYAHKSVTWRLRLAERLVDWVFSSSPEGFRLPSKKVIFTGQAINTELFKPTANSQKPKASFPLRLITIGRIAPVKNCETMIRACALLPKTIGKRPWTMTFVGSPVLPRDHAYLERIKTLAAELGLQERIMFLGGQPFGQIPDILRQHDIFLNASATGSLDKAVLEAMSCGLSVVTANEAYRRIVPPSSFLEQANPEAFARRITELASQPRPDSGLRDIVVRDHGLGHTIEKILSVLQTPLSTAGLIRPLSPLRMLYIVNARMPTEKAHGIQIAKMCEALIEQGVDCELAVPARAAPQSSLREFYGLRRDIPLRRLPVLDFYGRGRAGFLVASASFIFSSLFFVLWKRVRGWRGIVYTTDIDQFSFVGIPLLGVPFVMELHGAKLPRLRWRWFLRGAACLVVINRIIRDQISERFGIPKEKIAVHPNGIDLSFFASLPQRAEARRRLGISSTACMCLYVGRVYPWKGIDTFVEASRMLGARGVDVWFVGASNGEIQKSMGSADLPQNFHAAGPQSYQTIPLWLSAADVCVVLGTQTNEYSYYYTSPMKIFEYMAAEKPIVASNTPANREILSEREAFFYEPDNAADLAAKIQEVFDRPEEAAARVQAAAEKVKQWTWEKRAAGIIAHINNWLR